MREIEALRMWHLIHYNYLNYLITYRKCYRTPTLLFSVTLLILLPKYPLINTAKFINMTDSYHVRVVLKGSKCLWMCNIHLYLHLAYWDSLHHYGQ